MSVSLSKDQEQDMEFYDNSQNWLKADYLKIHVI